MKDNQITNYTMTEPKPGSFNKNKIGASAAVATPRPSFPNELFDYNANAQPISVKEATQNRNNTAAPHPANITGANNNAGQAPCIVGASYRNN